jgi:hypothetical protein
MARAPDGIVGARGVKDGAVVIVCHGVCISPKDREKCSGRPVAVRTPDLSIALWCPDPVDVGFLSISFCLRRSWQ